ncbi:PEP-CTERM system TPR-repeat protein PrsT [Undibacterium sp. Jales W-56]|uniref:XrtA/PEP-CTERM system TPR-repeat protein PrsT n=1 Tax=Undibacterium sp. Jales W-56 TaxID=2897325 RepID=UPI0021D24FE8|nr:XrtA/PEP-CTERM system TPR-repeat protein PrsT [Undibacterium sp. Jales W-56]MCU6434109.1 PEP-CTERM system TPR-repeat protein PrsT [Undibacterium sp. Jales W-56]
MSHKNSKRTSIAMLSASAVLLASLGACSKTQSTEKLLAEAKQYQQKGDSKAAIIQLKNALQKDPDNKDARFLLGSIYNETGDAVSAEKEIRKAISLGVNQNLVVMDLAKSLLAQGQYQKVLDETDKDPKSKTDATLLSLRGNAYLALGKTTEAKTAFEQALKDKESDPDALIGLAKQAFANKDLAGANSFSDQAVTKNPKNTAAWLFKGDLMRVQGKLDEALTAYGETLKLQPDNIQALLVRANLEISLKKFDEAKKDIDAAKKIASGNILVNYTQALFDFSQNKNTAAQESLQQVIRVAPDYMPAVLLSGAVQYAAGSTKLAEQDLRKYLSKVPNSVYAQKLLAAILLKSNQPKEAIPIIETALKITPEDSQLMAMAGESYMMTREFTKAAEYFDKASALAPQQSDYHTALGMSKLGQGDGSQAIAELEKAVNLDEKSVKAGVLLIMTHLKLKEYDKALAAAKVTEKEQPENPLIQNLKGGIYLNKKDIPNARLSFEKAVSLQANFFPAIANLARLDVLEKKPEAAKKRFEAVLEKDKKSLPAMTALANLAVSNGDNEGGKVWLERANTESPDNLSIIQMLTTQYLRMGENAKALTFVKKASVTNQKNPDLLNLLAKIQTVTGDKAAALDSYTKLAALLPESPAAQYQVATAYMTMGNETAALEALKKTLRLDEKFLDAQLAMASLDLKNGKFDEALTIAKQLQKQQEKSPAGFLIEGDTQLLQKKPSLAVKSYEQAMKLSANGPILIKLHNALIADAKTKEADARIGQWLKDHPDDGAVHLYWGTYQLNTQKNRTAAIEQFQLVLKNEPNNIPALNNIAWAYSEQKDKKAIEYAERAYKLSGDSPAIMDTLAWILLDQGDTARALPLLEKASNLQPDALEIRYHFAVALVKTGDKAKARKELENITTPGKSFAKLDEAKTLLKQL